MVHSGFTSPMNTPPSAPATAPPPATDAKPTSNSKPGSVTPAPTQPVFNGRTSGRKRTPKACDCCGPNSRGHDVQTPSRGRGRGRGRAWGRGAANNPDVTQRRPQIKTLDLKDVSLSEGEGTKMGADSPETANCIPSTVTEERLATRECGDSDIEMKVSEKAVEASEIKRKIEDNVCGSSTNVPVPSVANKHAKLEREVQPGTPKLSANGLRSSVAEESESQLTNGPSQSGPEPADTSIYIDQTCENSLALALSNGSAVKTQEDTDSGMSRPAAVPPPSHGPVSVLSEEHPRALRDHRMYCQQGTWSEVERWETTGERRGEAEEERERLLEMVHEFLESFYVKYGSFIPLTEADIVEHLKKKGTSDLTNKGLDLEKQVKQYRAGLASVPVAGFMVAHNKHTLSLEDLGTLEEQNWINDQIINMYGELIMEASEQSVHFFNSFFHKQLVAKGYEGVKRWTKKVDLFSKWLVLIPIHLEIHWSLVTVSMAHKTISYYDSQGIVFRHTTENIMKYLLAEAKEKKQAGFQKGWKITIIKGIPQQKNDSDCGVFVLEYCRCLSVKQPFRFSQEDMPRIRKRIYKELCDCQLDV